MLEGAKLTATKLPRPALLPGVVSFLAIRAEALGEGDSAIARLTYGGSLTDQAVDTRSWLVKLSARVMRPAVRPR